MNAVGCAIVAGFAAMPLFSCSGTRPSHLGINNSRLAPCPSTPNCVSSESADVAHAIAAFEIRGMPNAAWQELRAALARLPRTRIIAATADYIHAECSSAVFGFVDDVEFQLRSAEGVIALRSASRLGRSDFGVNRRRIETLRSQLVDRGVVR